MRKESDLTKHLALVQELVDIFLREEFLISGADGIDGYSPPLELRNEGYGDQEDKMPDVYAYDETRKCYIIGEAKTGAGDFESEHSLTQYNVFLDQFHRITGNQAILYVIVPASKIPEFNSLITHYIHPEYWKSIVLVSSTNVAT
ncbi:MAG: hypothetical protein WBD36_13435 [Bacteroidota bacterium]